MSWYEKLLDVGRDVAPTLAGGAATAASGGNPAIGAIVRSAMSKALGKTVEDEEKAAQEILGDPKATMEFRSRMKNADIKELEIRSRDVQSARKVIKNSVGPIVVSTIVTISFAVLVFMAMFVSIPTASQAVAYLLLGTLGTAFSQVLNFWLGTSLGSKEKDSTISRFAQAAERDQKNRSK